MMQHPTQWRRHVAPALAYSSLILPLMSTNRPVCRYFERNACSRGDQCTFAHVAAPPVWGPKKSSPATNSSNVCSFFLRNACTRGETCPFSHTVSSTSSPFPKAPCRFWQSGTCTKGSACTFSHDSELIPPNTAAVPPVRLACRFWTSGTCMKGVQCEFAHDTPKATPAVTAPKAEASVKVENQTCKHWLKGRCLSGSACPFLHQYHQAGTQSYSNSQPHQTENPSVAGKPTPPPKDPAAKSDEGTYKKSFAGSANAIFGPGAEVQSIITSFESMTVILGNLPPQVTQEELGNLLKDVEGVARPPVIADTDKNTFATVEFKDCSSAEKAVQTLRGSTLRSHSIAPRLHVHATDSGRGTFRNCTVKVSWWAPSLIAWAHYRDRNFARKRAEELNGRKFSGKPIKAVFQTPTWNQRTSFTVVLSSLPVTATARNLAPFCGVRSEADITIGETSYSFQDSVRDIKEKLQTFGPLETFDALDPKPTDTKCKALARFLDPEDASNAVKALHDKPQRFLRNSSLWVALMSSVKYTLPFRQYLALQDPIKALNSAELGSARMRIFDRNADGSKLDRVTIRIYGDDIKALSKLKTELERILRGENFSGSQGEGWDEHFQTLAGITFLQRIQAGPEAGVFISRDIRTRTIQLFGTEEKKTRAKQLIGEELLRVQGLRQLIPVGLHALRRLMTGELKQLQAQFGSDAVSLDVVARTVSVQASDKDALRTIRLSLQSMDQSNTSVLPSSNSDCPVCFCEATNPVALECGHTYCNACLHHLLTSAASTDSKFPIRCVGLDGNCSRAIALSIIRDILSPDEEAKLFEASFKSHVRARPNEYRHCPTPDCLQIYRPAAEGTILQCPTCIARICPACNVEYHEELTCSQHKYIGSEDDVAFQEWKRAHGVKPCPNCKADMEKNGGCDHMQCRVCHVHICWVCMKTFGDNGGDVYAHMNRVHGGIGIEIY